VEWAFYLCVSVTVATLWGLASHEAPFVYVQLMSVYVFVSSVRFVFQLLLPFYQNYSALEMVLRDMDMFCLLLSICFAFLSCKTKLYV
jgi:hypothetical protein